MKPKGQRIKMAKTYDYIVRFYKADGFINAYDESDHFDDEEVGITYVVKYESDLDGINYDTLITDKEPTLDEYLFVTAVHTFLPRSRFDKLIDKIFHCPDTNETYCLDELITKKMKEIYWPSFDEQRMLNIPKRKDEVDLGKVNAESFKHPFAHLVQGHNSIVFFWEIEAIAPELIHEDRIWFFDDIPSNSPRWTIGNMPIKSVIVRIKEMLGEGWILTQTTEEELEHLVLIKGKEN